MDWKKYVITFLITGGIFLVAFFLSDNINNKKIEVIKDTRDKIAIDILSTETRFALLSASSCSNSMQDNDFEASLTEELNNLAQKLKFIESQLGVDDEQVLIVKRQYTILQIKDYLLVQEFSKRCNQHVPTILYFHENDCADCRKQSIVLDKIHELFPQVRVYWLDRGLDDPTMRTLVSMFKITQVPSLVFEEKKYDGLQDLDVLTALLEKEKNPLQNAKNSTRPKSAPSSQTTLQ